MAAKKRTQSTSFQDDLLAIKKSVDRAKRERKQLANAPERQRKRLLGFLVFCCLALAAMSYDGLQQAAHEKLVEIIALLDPASLLKTGGRVWQEAAVHETVQTGDEIRTGAGGGAHLEFPDDTVIKIGPQALFYVRYSGFTRATGSRKREFDLWGGRVWFRVSKLVGGDSYFRVNTPTAVAAVRGTRFSVMVYRNTGNPATPDGTTLISVEDGLVQVIPRAAPQRTDVKPMQQTVMIPGSRDPATPVPMSGQEQQAWQAQRTDLLSQKTLGRADVLSDPPSSLPARIRRAATFVQEQLLLRPVGSVGAALNIKPLSGPDEEDPGAAPLQSADQGAYAKAMIAGRALQMAIEHSYDPVEGYPARIGATDLAGVTASRDEIKKILDNIQDNKLMDYRRAGAKYECYIQAKQPSDKLIKVTPDSVQAVGDISTK